MGSLPTKATFRHLLLNQIELIIIFFKNKIHFLLIHLREMTNIFYHLYIVTFIYIEKKILNFK